MRILIAWDNPDEAELLGLYLGAGDNLVEIAHTRQEWYARLGQGPWDVALLAMTFPAAADGLSAFAMAQETLPGVPVVVACRETEMLHLARFLARGLRSYRVRDARGDLVFLVLSALESTVAGARAEEARKLAERLHEEVDGVRRLQESIIPGGLQAPPGYCRRPAGCCCTPTGWRRRSRWRGASTGPSGCGASARRGGRAGGATWRRRVTDCWGPRTPSRTARAGTTTPRWSC
jgi:CheY-like chemotaxis protein